MILQLLRKQADEIGLMVIYLGKVELFSHKSFLWVVTKEGKSKNTIKDSFKRQRLYTRKEYFYRTSATVGNN